MGIFDAVVGNRADQPINLVGRYQSQMQRAAYSPTVAQAAARSGANPTLATRVAAREVAGEMNSALPSLIAQEAQMNEARRIEDINRERQMIAAGLNIGGQALGTALSAYGGGGGATPGAGQAAGLATGSLAGSIANSGAQPRATPLPSVAYATPASVQPVASPQPMAAPTASAGTQTTMDQPIYTTPTQTPVAPAVNYAQEIPEVWQATSGAPSNPADELLNTLPNQRNIRRRQPRQRRNG